MPPVYWLASFPLKGTKESTWNTIQETVARTSQDTQVFKFHIPELRVGTLDSLLALSDDLVKINSQLEGTVIKIKRQLEEVERASGSEPTLLTVDGMPVDSYITRFQWDEAKYPVMSPLKEIVDMITETVSSLEDDLKVRVSEYNNVKSQLSALNRKNTGSMAVRDLSNLVNPEDIIASEHLITLLVVVSKFSEKEWLNSYETLTQFVVPRSSNMLAEDNEYALFTVVLFKKVADTFKTKARERGFQVRDFDYDPESSSQREELQEKLTAEQESLKISLQHWCSASYGEVFSAWLHVCAVRLFAESILRHGLPPAFQAVAISPNQKHEKRVRQALESLVGGDKSQWKGGEDIVIPGLAGDSELYPYVSLTINAG